MNENNKLKLTEKRIKFLLKQSKNGVKYLEKQLKRVFVKPTNLFIIK